MEKILFYDTDHDSPNSVIKLSCDLGGIFIYNYFTWKFRKFYFTKGSPDNFCMQNIQTATRDVLVAKL